jgi:hypothetical protein
MNPMHFLARLYEWGDCLMWSLAVLSVPFWLYVVAYAVPEAKMVAQQQQQDDTWRENRFFCERYGMPAGTPEHIRCIKDLTGIRTQERRRVGAETAGIF